ncbi:hypothetical protein SDRG_11203 [Saprolegnia diclina VS20]|uniref:DUF6604 domain-containing protein n=1 Tax=Saprolegnia diclina (strain VS20) TaxID=1156394 RepID=T0Q8R0_SAPDV|nr:hypothetical protein SDRG_11203 [Saprolegnia diclina VS20]EQC31016.1 hypothetical protein SDRG_11203 [Saprolegnia diclina VS20]|eukprot:XP_008615455.1 hypothetical protein SDRG_11203 [Saprolegnia diclina VS20]
MAPDAGHTHVLNTLCAIEVQWTPLVPIKTPGPVSEASGDAANSHVNVTNAFEALATDDVDDDADVWAETPMTPFDMTTFVTPVGAADAARAALLARIEDEKFQCRCFLLDFDDLMREVKLAWKMFKDGQTSLLAATAVTNACVHSVQVLGNDLSFAHPHLKDLDHILAVFVCSDLLVDLVSDHDGLRLGTAVELVVLAKRSMIERLRPGAERTIAKTLKTTTAAAAYYHASVCAQFNFELASAIFNGPSTLDRSLMLLQDRLVCTHDAIKPEKCMILRDGFFGRSWAEPHELASSLEDLHQTFFGHILPLLVIHVRERNTLKTANETSTSPLLELVRAYVKSKDISLALIFACQSLLWSLLCTQGTPNDAMHCAKVVDDTRVTIDRLARDMQALRDNVDGILVPPTTEKNTLNVLFWFDTLRRITSPNNSFSQLEVDRAWFNPYMAGQLLLTVTIEITFVMGLITMDDIGQTRMVLHLYNALRVLDKIPPNRDLDNLVAMFERGKSVWVGGRPTARGGFVKAHLLAWGYNASTATTMAANLLSDKETVLAKAAHSDKMDRRSAAQKKTFKVSDIARMLLPTDPAPVSKAYRYVTRTMLPDDVDATRLPRALDIMDVVESDFNAFLYLDLNKVGQLFRGAWKDVIHTLGLNRLALVPARGIVDGPWHESDANIRHQSENLCFQTLLALCDRDPDDDRVLKIAEALMHLTERLPEAYLTSPAVAP